jgi:hypothetical protein
MSIYKKVILKPIKEKGYVMIMPTEPVEEFDELIEDETIITDENGAKVFYKSIEAKVVRYKSDLPNMQSANCRGR